MPLESCYENGIATLRCGSLILGNLINYGITFAGIVAVFFITISGIKLLSSGGDPVKVAEARKTLTFAIIGLTLIIMSFGIVRLVGRFSGIDCAILGLEKCK